MTNPNALASNNVTNSSYVKVQNSEVNSSDGAFQGGQLNNYTTTAGGPNSRIVGGIPHTLGNSLGGNSNYGGFFTAIQRDSSLNENNTLAKTGINLNSLIK